MAVRRDIDHEAVDRHHPSDLLAERRADHGHGALGARHRHPYRGLEAGGRRAHPPAHGDPAVTGQKRGVHQADRADSHRRQCALQGREHHRPWRLVVVTAVRHLDLLHAGVQDLGREPAHASTQLEHRLQAAEHVAREAR